MSLHGRERRAFFRSVIGDGGRCGQMLSTSHSDRGGLQVRINRHLHKALCQGLGRLVGFAHRIPLEPQSPSYQFEERVRNISEVLIAKPTATTKPNASWINPRQSCVPNANTGSMKKKSKPTTKRRTTVAANTPSHIIAAPANEI